MRNSLPFSEPYRKFYLTAVLLDFAGAGWLCAVAHLEGHTLVVCPSKLLWNIPCPGCGMTRATICLLHGDLLSAVKYNPNSVIFVPALLVGGLAGLVDMIKSRLYAYKLFLSTERFISKPVPFLVFVLFELFVLVHNIAVGI